MFRLMYKEPSGTKKMLIYAASYVVLHCLYIRLRSQLAVSQNFTVGKEIVHNVSGVLFIDVCLKIRCF